MNKCIDMHNTADMIKLYTIPCLEIQMKHPNEVRVR
jgi:hypothetical protein